VIGRTTLAEAALWLLLERSLCSSQCLWPASARRQFVIFLPPHAAIMRPCKTSSSQLALTIRALLLGLHDCLAAAAVWVVARSIFGALT